MNYKIKIEPKIKMLKINGFDYTLITNCKIIEVFIPDDTNCDIPDTL